MPKKTSLSDLVEVEPEVDLDALKQFSAGANPKSKVVVKEPVKEVTKEKLVIYSLRLDESDHEMLKDIADKSNHSINSFINAKMKPIIKEAHKKIKSIPEI